MRFLSNVLLVATLSTGSLSCAGLQVGDIFDPSNPDAPLTESTVIDGLKEALRVGKERTSSSLSALGGFTDHALLRIVLPDEFETVAGTLRRVGLGSQVDDFETTMNRAAERAAGEAVDVFVSAIRGMSVQDAFGILQGPDNGLLTDYLFKCLWPPLSG